MTRRLWESKHQAEMTLLEAVDLCRRCHQLAPFCFFNGNTFAAIARTLTEQLQMGARELYIIRSVIGHVVAGTATQEEERQLQGIVQKLRK